MTDPNAGLRRFLNDLTAHARLLGDRLPDVGQAPEKAATAPLDAGRGLQGCSAEPRNPHRNPK